LREDSGSYRNADNERSASSQNAAMVERQTHYV